MKPYLHAKLVSMWVLRLLDFASSTGLIQILSGVNFYGNLDLHVSQLSESEN